MVTIRSKLGLGLVLAFAITAESTAAPKPDIEITGSGVVISDGDITPDVTDDTEFGTVAVSGGTVTHTFRIENTGGGGDNLALNGNPVPVILATGSDFTVTAQPALTSLAVGEWTTFDIQFDPSTTGLISDSISIPTNVTGGRSNYTFTIQGTGQSAATPPTLSTTLTIAALEDTTATLGGEVTDIGSSNVTERGVYWSESSGFTPPGQGTKDFSVGDDGAPFSFTEPVTGLTDGAMIYFQAFAANGAGESYSGSEGSFRTEPSVQASTITFSSVGQTSMDIGWTAAGVDGSIVIMKAGSTMTQLPSDWTEHAFDLAFGNGTTELGGSGEYVVYRGAVNPITVTNLVANTLYTVRVFTYAGSGTTTNTGINYQQDSPPESSQTTAAAGTPPTLSTTLTIAAIEDTTATLGGEVTDIGSSNVTDRGVYWSETSGFTPPGQGTKDFSVGDDGAPFSFTEPVTGLTDGAMIYFKAFAANSAGESYSSNEGSFQTEPTVQASTITFSSVGQNSMDIGWTAAGVDGSIVIMKAGSTMTQLPSDWTEHAFDLAFGNGTTELGGSGEYVIYRGAANPITVSNLVANTLYTVRVFTYAGSGTTTNTGINYQQDSPPEDSQTTNPAGPSAPIVSNASIANIEDVTATLGGEITDTGGENASERGIYWSETPGFTPPGVGTKVWETGDYGAVPFSVAVSALTDSAMIYFQAFATNTQGTGFSSEDSFQTEPTAQPSNILFSSITSSSITVSWDAGGGDGVLVLAKQGATFTQAPSDWNEHAASSSFGAGATELGGAGEYVVFRGPGNSVNVTSLQAETTYYFKLFEYSGSGETTNIGINYQQDGAPEGNEITDVASGTQSHNSQHNVDCVQCHSLHSGPLVPRDAVQLSKCTYCHNSTDMAGKPEKWEVALHVVSGGSTTVDCGSCHMVHLYDFNSDNTSHGGVVAENISRIRWDTSKYVTGALEPAIYQEKPGHFAFAEADWPSGPFNGICQSCHQNTSNHTQDGWDDDSGVAADNDHYIGQVCTSCHAHIDGFQPSGCKDCHNTTRDNDDGAPTRRAIVGEFSTPNLSHHVDGASMTNDDCKVCHYEAVDGAYHKNNLVDLRDPDTGSRITLQSTGNGFTKFTRDRSSDVLEEWITTIQDEFCLKCHDGGVNAGATATYNAGDGGTALRPFSTTTRDVPNVFDGFDPTNQFHHAVRDAVDNPYCIPSGSNGSNVTMESPWNQDSTGGPYSDGHDMITCFDCHGDVVTDPDGTSNLISAHGGSNQRMLRTAIDFDGIEAAGAAGDIAQIPANARFDTETFCTVCHKSSVYVTTSDPEAVGSIFEHHGQSQSQHTAGGGNELGCMGCHAGIVDFSTLSDNGALRGNLHGDNFTWPGDSFSTGVATEHYMLGGWLSGWEIVGSTGYCRGGECNHKNSSKNYSR